MKKTTLLKSMLLLCALIVGSSSVWATDVVFTFNTDAGIAELGISKPSASNGTNLSTSSAYTINGVSLSVKNGTGTATRVWNSSGTLDLRIYSGSSFTFTAPGNITSIVLAGNTVGGFSCGEVGSFSSGTWTGDAESVELTATATEKINTITVTYTVSDTEYDVNLAAVTNGSIARDKAKAKTGETVTLTATPNSGYVTGVWTVTDASSNAVATTKTGENTATFTMPAKNVTVSATFIAVHTATFNINGDTSSDEFAEGADITFPADPEIDGLAFMGWTTTPIVGTTDTEPAVLVDAATMGGADITYYAVFAKKTVIEDEFTKSYGFETESDENWTIDGPSRSNDRANSGSYSGKITTNNTYVTFKHKVNVKEFSFAFTRTSTNNNYNVYVETSTDGSDWSAAETYAMNTFNSDGTFSTKTKTFDGTKAYYVRFHCYNTTAARYVDDVTIVYDGEEVSYSAYRTSIPTFAVSIGSAKYATFCDEVARDFSASGITVYAASATASSVEFDEVTDGIVPANTGVVLFSETTKADVAIPVATTDASYDFSSNEMIGVNAKTLVAYAGEGSKKNFILANGTSGVGFYKAKDTGANLAAHKAYLSTATAASARDFLGFGDETTGIEKVEAAKQNAGVYFNLAGQRVVNPTKGLYIVNGKKVIK